MDTTDRYLAEIGKKPLLTHEEVVELAKRKDAGDIGARNEIVERNQRLVVRIAKGYIKHCHSMDLMDLVQYGNLGLMRAADKFDWRLGFRFSTYATYWISQTIDRGLMQDDRDIRIPVHRMKEIRRMLREDGVDLYLEKINERPISLNHDREYQDNHSGSFHIDPPDPINQYAEVDYARLNDTVKDALDDFAQDRGWPQAERHARIFRKRMGIDTGESVTLEEAGVDEGITRERVRQICVKVEERLRLELA